jgi:hypothetical protein
MPPVLDTYVLTKQRNEEAIERFLDAYVDVQTSEDRGDKELSILRMDAASEGPIDAYEWEPATTLSHIIHRGLSHPRRAFTVYLNSKHERIGYATLAFTSYDQTIFGLAVDDEGANPENLRYCQTLLHDMASAFDCYRGFIIVQSPPPLTEEGFQEAISDPLTEFVWDRDVHPI